MDMMKWEVNMDLNWLEFAGVCAIGTVALLLIFLVIEIAKEVLKKDFNNKENKDK